MNIRLINRILVTYLLLLISVTSNAQISTNQGFEILGNVPSDTRDTLTTLGDTSNVVWIYPGLLSYVVDQDQFWYNNGSYWKLFESGGLNNFYASGDTLYALSPDSLFAVYLGNYLDNDTIYQTLSLSNDTLYLTDGGSVFLPYIDSLLLADTTGVLRSLIDLAGSQYIDTLQLQGDTMLQLSLFGDNQPLKELNLSALSGDNLGNHVMTQNLVTDGNWISGDGGNEGVSVDAAGKIGIGTLTPGYILDINSTNAVRLPVGTTAQRPTGDNGLLRYNSDLSQFEGYYNAEWNGLPSTLADISSNSTDLASSTYTLSAATNVKFVSSAGRDIMTISESTENITIGNILSTGTTTLTSGLAGAPQLLIDGKSSAANSFAGFRLQNFLNRQANFSFTNSNFSSFWRSKPDALVVETNGAGGIILNTSNSASTIDFVTNSYTTVSASVLAMRINGSGNVGIKTTSPTAGLHLPAGTATANTSPLKFTSGTNLTTPEAGAMEWDGTNLFITQTTGPTRKQIAYTTDIVGDGNGLISALPAGDITIDAGGNDLTIFNAGLSSTRLDLTSNYARIGNASLGGSQSFYEAFQDSILTYFTTGNNIGELLMVEDSLRLKQTIGTNEYTLSVSANGLGFKKVGLSTDNYYFPLTSPTANTILGDSNGDRILEWIDYSGFLSSELNDLSSVVTWDTIPDLYVQSSSVVQHEGDLTIDNIPLNRIPYGTGTTLTSESGFTYDGSNLYVDYNDADSYTWLRTAGLGSRTLYLSDQSSTTDKYIRVSNDDGIYYSQQFLDSSLLAKELILDYRLKLVYNAGGEYHGADFFDFANGSSSLWSYKSSANGGSTTTLNLRTHTNAQTTDDIADASVLFLQTGRWGTTETESIFNETEWETRNHPNANETLGSILFGTRVDEGFNVVDYVGAAIYAETPGDWSGSSTPAYISFATTPTGSASSPTRIMTLNATQDVVLNSYWSGNKIGTSTKYLMAIDTLDGRLFKLPIDSIGSGVYLTSEINDLTSAVTWANVPDANITQSSVTQHQAALSITESQISDLAHTPNQTIDTLSYDNTTGILSASLSNDGVAASTVDLDRYYTPGKIPYSDGSGFLTTGNVNYNSTPTYTNGLIDINHTSSWTAALSIDMDGDTTVNNNFSIVPRSSGGQELNFNTNGQSNASTTNIITHVMNGDPLPGFLNSQLSHMGFFVVRNTGNETDGIINDTVSSVTNKPAFVFFNGNGSDGNFIPEVLGIGVGNTGTTGGPNIVIYHRDSTVDNSASFPPHNFLYTNSTGVVMSAPGTKFPVTNPLGGTNQLQAALDSLNANLGGGGATQLSDLTDINTSTPTNRNVLVADGVDWESRALVEADISDLTHTGNGIFDIANDEATVPAGLNARLGGDFSISNSTGDIFFVTKGASQSVGVGSSSTSAGYSLSVSKSISGTSGTVGDIAIGSSIAPATTSSLVYNGIVSSPIISGTSNKTGDITAAVFYPYNSGSGTISNLYGVKITPVTLAGTITNLRSLAIAPNRIVGGTVTNVTNIELGLNGTAYTNYSGLKVLNTTAATTAQAITLEMNSGTNKYNIYASGSADNYFAGDVGIGVSSPDYKLDVTGTLGVTGTVRFEGYGAGNKEVGDLALTNSGYLATYATDGTLMEVGLTNPYGGESSITGILDSLYANQGSGGITSLNGLTGSTQNLATSTSGPIGWSSSGTTHTLLLPNATESVRGVVSTAAQTFAGNKTFTGPTTRFDGDLPEIMLKSTSATFWTANEKTAFGLEDNELGSITYNDFSGTAHGGLKLKGSNRSTTPTQIIGIQYEANVSNEPTLVGAHYFDVRKHDGFGAITDIAAGSKAAMFTNDDTPLFTIYGDGDVESAGNVQVGQNLTLINGSIADENVSLGNTGEVLSRTATGVDWVDPGSLASYAEMYINLTDPDTISFAGISDSLITETTAGELANFTHSNGRLTYTGSATIKVAVRVSASFTYDNIGTLGLLVYKNGTYQEKSRAEHNILSGEANSARIRPISTNCILTLSQNDYVEVGWETNTAGSTVLTTEDLNVIVTKL